MIFETGDNTRGTTQIALFAPLSGLRQAPRLNAAHAGGVYSLSLYDDSPFIIISYLTGVHLFSGVLNLVKALSEIRSSISFWKTDMLQAGVNFVMAVLCLTFRHTPSVLVYLYAAGLFYSAAVRIWSVFRRTAIVYIS